MSEKALFYDLDRTGRADGRRLQAFGTICEPDLHRLSGNKTVQTGLTQDDHVHEHVAIGVVWAHKAVSFVRIEPFDRCGNELAAAVLQRMRHKVEICSSTP